MSSAEETRPNREAARPSSFAAVPGWMISGMLHAGVIVFLVTSGLPSCGDGQIGTGADQGQFRDVGIYVKQPTESLTTTKKTDSESSQENQTASKSTANAKSTKAADEAASDLIDLPDVKPRQVIGQSRGGPTEVGLPNNPEALVTPNAVRVPQAKGQGPGNVSFMGKTTPAQSVVYVIDTSSSMKNNDAMKFARARLKQSINGLTAKQKFQIISYTLVPTVMRLGNSRSGSPPLYRAIGPNLRMATRFINGIEAKGGTKHQPALVEAFRFQPDVIFFLTDADVDRLSPSQLSEIKNRWNKQGKTHIHCIKFGQGPDLSPASRNFLRTLSGENRGSYTYIDISKLDGP